MGEQTDRTFEIEGTVVRCIELDGDRLWRCECATFQERLLRLGEGFCQHTAGAIMHFFAG